MTQEDVIVLWKDANGWDVGGYKNTLEDLERFAKLVAKHTLSNIDPSKFMSHQEVMEAARLAERERILQLIKELRPAIKPLEGMGRGKTTEEWFDILAQAIEEKNT